MKTICDTGPLLAYLNKNDPFHEWAVRQMQRIAPPLVTCDAVLTEAAYFLREDKLSVDPLFALMEREALVIDFDSTKYWERLRKLMDRFRQMDFADACIVAMTERWDRCQVLTLDKRDFSVYRRHDRQVICFVAP